MFINLTDLCEQLLGLTWGGGGALEASLVKKNIK